MKRLESVFTHQKPGFMIDFSLMDHCGSKNKLKKKNNNTPQHLYQQRQDELFHFLCDFKLFHTPKEKS